MHAVYASVVADGIREGGAASAAASNTATMANTNARARLPAAAAACEAAATSNTSSSTDGGACSCRQLVLLAWAQCGAEAIAEGQRWPRGAICRLGEQRSMGPHLGGSHERHKLECLDTLDLTWLRPSGTLLSCAVICALAPVGLALAPAVTLAVTLAQAPAATLALAVALAVGLVVALRSVCSALEVCAEAAAHMATLGLS